MRNSLLAISGLFFGLTCFVFSPQASYAKGKADEVMKKYPESRYIVRSAGGESPEQAAEAARLEISKFFEAKISGESLVREWARASSARGKTSQAHMTEIANTIVVGSARDIPGIEIVASQEDKDSKRFEAWAVLDRAKYGQTLLERIQGADSAVDRRLAQPGDNDLKRVACMAKCMQDLATREKDRGDLGLLGQTVESRGTLLNQIMSSMDSLVSGALDVALIFEGNTDEKVQSALLKGIVDAGIRVKNQPDMAAAAGAGADIAMTVAHQVTTRKTNSTISGKDYTFHWAEWMLTVKAMDPASGQVIDTTVSSDKVSGGSEEQARERMVGRVLQIQAPKLTSWVYGVIFKSDEK